MEAAQRSAAQLRDEDMSSGMRTRLMQPYDDEDTSYATLPYSLTKCTRTRTRTIAQAKEKMMNEKLQRETLAGVKDVGTAVRALASCV